MENTWWKQRQQVCIQRLINCWHLTVTFDVIYVKIKSVTGLNINNKILVSHLTIIVKFETKIYATDLRTTKNNVLVTIFQVSAGEGMGK